ncbi:enoyl-CoA hydratase/isomerase family protein [Vulgatibacter sp.]|uniref:enoyl-CoA hydratase/isomerase family protein n=1 Tax=Vulgatibacter sp. TaxID=1971226 RepID=UPI0035699DCC
MAAAPLVLVDLPAEGVARLTLDRPAALNALSIDLCRELTTRLGEVQCDSAVRAVVLAGAGKAFCAGGDIPAMREAGDRVDVFLRELTLGLHGVVSAITRMPKPVIGAVKGAAGGGGLSLALACDLLVCAEDAKLVSAYTAIGLTPDGGLTFQLTRALGPHRAMAHILRNEPLLPADAKAHGLVHTVAPAAEVDEKAVALAAELARGPTRAFAVAKRMVWRYDSLESTLEEERQNISDSAATADGREGVAAFLEKRKATFTGR